MSAATFLPLKFRGAAPGAFQVELYWVEAQLAAAKAAPTSTANFDRSMLTSLFMYGARARAGPVASPADCMRRSRPRTPFSGTLQLMTGKNQRGSRLHCTPA
jgi:hypothetical protein